MIVCRNEERLTLVILSLSLSLSLSPPSRARFTRYIIHWPTPLSCAPKKASSCPQSVIPKPTADQLLFQEMELGALVCYNMATTDGTQGCAAHQVPPATTFTNVAPETVDTDGWCNAIASFGGKYVNYSTTLRLQCGSMMLCDADERQLLVQLFLTWQPS